MVIPGIKSKEYQAIALTNPSEHHWQSPNNAIRKMFV